MAGTILHNRGIANQGEKQTKTSYMPLLFWLLYILKASSDISHEEELSRVGDLEEKGGILLGEIQNYLS